MKKLKRGQSKVSVQGTFYQKSQSLGSRDEERRRWKDVSWNTQD